MADSPSRWVRALRPVSMVTMAGLTVQYVAGLLANAYAPSNGFTENTDYWQLNLHWDFGYVLGALALILLIVAALTRKRTFIGLSTVTFAGVLSAAIFGMLYVRSTPNDPLFTVAMGFSFLVAFTSNFILTRFALPPSPAATSPIPTSPTPSAPS
ncbi:MAG TPA: hypothetical protein VGX00_02175 [Thermoplasmata archaeon]|nr:hypothetical protein [Thermoplasmata archaeon]